MIRQEGSTLLFWSANRKRKDEYIMSNERIMPVDLGDTATLDNDTWLKWRAHGNNVTGYIPVTVTGSECASVVGMVENDAPPAKWTSRTELWHKKAGTGLKAEKPMNQHALEMGHLFEPVVGKIFKTEMEKKGHTVALITDKHMYQCGKLLLDEEGFPVCDENGDPKLAYPFALADVDGTPIVDGQMCILECKTTNSQNFDNIRKWKEGICPPYYEYQCRWYMAVMDLPKTYICCMWGLGEYDHSIIEIERNMEIEEALLNDAKAFVESVVNRREPDPESENQQLLRAFYVQLYGESQSTKEIDITSKLDDADELIDDLYKTDLNIKRTQEKLESLESDKSGLLNKMAPFFAESEHLKLANAKRVIYIDVANERSRGGISEKSVKAVDPALLSLGIGGFSATTFQKNLNEKIKALRKEAAKALARADSVIADALNAEADDLIGKLEACREKKEFKGKQEIGVRASASVYDAPKVKSI